MYITSFALCLFPNLNGILGTSVHTPEAIDAVAPPNRTIVKCDVLYRTKFHTLFAIYAFFVSVEFFIKILVHVSHKLIPLLG